jgi:hypothetical protein
MTAHATTFGSDGPSDDESAAYAARMNAPENQIPVDVPISALLARTDDVAVALIGGHAYTSGFSFTVAVRFRQEPRGTMAQKSHAILSGYPAEDGDELLLLGLEFADGRTATNLQHPGFGFGFAPGFGDRDRPVLTPMGGGGGGRSFDQSFWVAPLPPAGPLSVVCAWTAVDIPETTHTLDGTAIAEAGSRAVTLWPYERPPDQEANEPVLPKVPEGGWFAEVVRRLEGDRSAG